MKKLAHRGYSAKYPENTMEAFIKAYEQGFDGVETDVHLTLDDELVLIHDEKINRTSTGKGYVKDHTLKELRNYNFNYKVNDFNDNNKLHRYQENFLCLSFLFKNYSMNI